MKWLNISSIDWVLMLPVFVLITLSLITLAIIDPSIFKAQLIFTVISIFIFLLITQFNTSVLRYYSIPIYITSIVLLVAVLFLGAESRGSTRWFNLFGLGIQFSEILKPLLALSLATHLVSLRNMSFKSFIATFLLLGPIMVLIVLQPDLGNALIYGFVVLGALFIYGFPLRMFAAGFVAWLASLPVLLLFLHDYQRQRILTFFNPGNDPLGTSYNAIQSVIAVGSGMMIGKGLGQGTQAGLRFLPERHTDFIFATIAEQFGFIGAIIIVACFAVILFRLYKIVVNSEDKFSKIFSSVVFLIIFTHFFINIGMNLAILPIVGVTLPFVSSGGSSLLSNFILLGLLFAVNKKSRRDVLEIG